MGNQNEPRTVVYLGNRAAVEVSHDADGNRIATPLDGKRCTTIQVAPGMTLMQAAADITSSQGVWAAHSQPGATPAWVASTDPVLAQLLASHFKCELRDPEPDTGPGGTQPAADDGQPGQEG